MNPLLELKERLTACAIAGTQLIEGDFRLKRAIEAFAPLAGKNPVFGRIADGLQKLMEPQEPSQRNHRLLELLGLLDAVLYTQAATAIEGTLEPAAQLHAGQSLYLQLPYSQLQPLLEALSTTGSGRMETITQALRIQPELFADYRLLRALVQDLGDTYSEMADLVQNLLECLGTAAPLQLHSLEDYSKTVPITLPKVEPELLVALLKQDFDPQGKKEMERRIALVSRIAGAAENDWYLSLLGEGTGKELRVQAILALGCSGQNLPLLLELCAAEKGKAREAALSSLGAMQLPEAEEFWKQELKKRPQSAAFLQEPLSSQLEGYMAEQFTALLEKLASCAETDGSVSAAQAALLGGWVEASFARSSEGMYRAYILLVQLLPRLSALKTTKSTLDKMVDLHKICLNICLLLLRSPVPELLDTVQQNRKAIPDQEDFVLFLTDFLSLPADKVYQNWAHLPQSYETRLLQLFFMVEVQDGQLYVTSKYVDSFYSLKLTEPLRQPAREPLDLRWFDTLMNMKYSASLFPKLISDQPQELLDRIAAHCYQVARTIVPPQGGHYNSYASFNTILYCLDTMLLCGAPTCTGILHNMVLRRIYVFPGPLAQVLQRYKKFQQDNTQEFTDVLRHIAGNPSWFTVTKEEVERLIEQAGL